MLTLTANGRTQKLRAWAEETGTSWPRIYNRRFNLGWTDAQALGLEPRPPRSATCKTLTAQGVTQSYAGWAKQTNLPVGLIYARKRLGWSDEQAVGPKVGRCGPHPLRLTPDDVRAARSGKESDAAIARRAGCTPEAVRAARRGLTHKGVT